MSLALETHKKGEPDYKTVKNAGRAVIGLNVE